MWPALAYALTYQVALGPANGRLTIAAIAWAGRPTAVMLRDAMRLPSEFGEGDYQRLWRSAWLFLERYADRHGRPATARDLITDVRGIRNAAEAWAIGGPIRVGL